MKRIITMAIALTILGGFQMAMAQSSDMLIAALSDNPAAKPVMANAYIMETPQSVVQVGMLTDAGEQLLKTGHTVESIQVWLRTAALASREELSEAAELLNFKLGYAFWQLSKEEGNPAHAMVAGAFWTQAADTGLDDPRCAHMVASDSECAVQ